MIVMKLSLVSPAGTASRPRKRRRQETLPAFPRWLGLVLSHPSLRWCRYGAFVLMNLLSASFYPVARLSLERIDP
ncbi:MAG: hypothetical protein IMW89_13965, partial [Ktedonobacteraceae bacterium]|nr:hypothetical protein [Ktedonobacteraceae bacterium]